MRIRDARGYVGRYVAVETKRGKTRNETSRRWKVSRAGEKRDVETRGITAKNKQAEGNTSGVIGTTDTIFLLQPPVAAYDLYFAHVTRVQSFVARHPLPAEARPENCGGIKFYIPREIHCAPRSIRAYDRVVFMIDRPGASQHDNASHARTNLDAVASARTRRCISPELPSAKFVTKTSIPSSILDNARDSFA